MAALAFDTLEASKTLRNAGVEERAADAFVEIVRRTTELPDISHVATKADLNELRAATKADLNELRAATKADLAPVALKSEVADLRAEMLGMEARLTERLRVQGWQLLGGMGAPIAAAVAIIKLVP